LSDLRMLRCHGSDPGGRNHAQEPVSGRQPVLQSTRRHNSAAAGEVTPGKGTHGKRQPSFRACQSCKSARSRCSCGQLHPWPGFSEAKKALQLLPCFVFKQLRAKGARKRRKYVKGRAVKPRPTHCCPTRSVYCTQSRLPPFTQQQRTEVGCWTAQAAQLSELRTGGAANGGKVETAAAIV
jgi:hypothetical protein